MMRFSTRDLMWATLVVAMGLGWWNEHRAHRETDAKRLEVIGQAYRQRTTLLAAKAQNDNLHRFVEGGHVDRVGLRYPLPIGDTPNWRVLDEPLVEP
jgi:hypothetical protein